MVAVRSFVRRVLLQAVVSGTAMAGLQLALHYGPGLLPPSAPSREADRSRPADTHASGPPRQRAAAVVTAAYAIDRTHADVRAGRFPAWRERKVQTADLPPDQPSAASDGSGIGDVLMFDRCRPDCESRDPLLAANRRPKTPTETRIAPDAAAAEALVVSSVTEEDRSANRGVVTSAMHTGAFLARRIADTATGIVGW